MLVAEEAVEIRVLSRQGKSIREISRMLDMSRNTVRSYLRSEGLPRYERETRPSKLDPYKQYIDERVETAAPDWIPATVLLRELRSLGSASLAQTAEYYARYGNPASRCSIALS
jgi:transposase